VHLRSIQRPSPNEISSVSTFVVAVIIVLGATAGALWVRQSARRADQALAHKIRRHRLEDFDRKLTEDVRRRVRPMDHLALTRMMTEVLEQIANARPGSGQAAIVEPPDAGYRLACEELVTLGRLVRLGPGVYTQGVPASQ
jgi:hypothetical protein